MSDLIYISRSFVEFGGFTASEILDFEKRGIIGDQDFVSVHDTKHWVPLQDWIKNIPEVAASKNEVAKVEADLKAPEKTIPIKGKPAAKEKAAPAKKAAAKKAKKAV